MVKEIKSDIFLAPTNAIVHQANCFHTMGSGIAKVIREKFPQAYDADLLTKKGDRGKLGTFSVAKIQSKENPDLKCIINLYSQFDFGRDTRHTSYDAMNDGLTLLNERLSVYFDQTANPLIKTIAIPYRIGSNLGGADWNVVKAIIYSVFEKSPLKVLICENPALAGEQLLNSASK